MFVRKEHIWSDGPRRCALHFLERRTLPPNSKMPPPQICDCPPLLTITSTQIVPGPRRPVFVTSGIGKGLAADQGTKETGRVEK